MKFVTIREFRMKPDFVWQALKDQKEVVLTVNGKPVGILTGTDGDRVEQDVKAIRRARMRRAIEGIQQDARKRGLHKWSMKKINAVIDEVRRERRS
jgi:hypothetical protein